VCQVKVVDNNVGMVLTEISNPPSPLLLVLRALLSRCGRVVMRRVSDIRQTPSTDRSVSYSTLLVLLVVVVVVLVLVLVVLQPVVFIEILISLLWP